LAVHKSNTVHKAGPADAGQKAYADIERDSPALARETE
jgi:hypothetical protein